MKRLIYFTSSSYGGLADYAHEQANALVQLGVDVEMLTTAQYRQRADCRYKIRAVLVDSTHRTRSGLAQRVSWVSCILKNVRTLNREILQGEYTAVLMGAYSEYLAPLWSRQLRCRARDGVVFGAIIHDPVRDFVVGPYWWHRRSVAAAYSFLREAFVHEEIQLDTVRSMPSLRTTVIPHGPYSFPEPTESRKQIRKKLAIPDDAFVALSFGHIRDGKNLDLVIQAMADVPEVYLVVAGKEQSSAQKPISYYQELAKKYSVASRCQWIHKHVPATEVGNLFIAADLVLLTYSRDFRSASGVLNAAISFRKPCVASSGGGNLCSVVERYNLGWFVEPDSLPALKAGIATAVQEMIDPRWEAYESENSWGRNAQLVNEKMFGSIL